MLLHVRLLGIDYGTKKVGVALSDGEGSMAFPHAVIENNAQLVSKILDIIEKEGVEKIIIGHSVNYEGVDNPVMEQARACVEEIKEKTDIPVHFEPEMLTTVEARRLQGHHQHIDASAAALILNSFIERNNHGTHID